MTTLPLIHDTTPGIYQVCTNANTDYAIAVPAGAVGCVLWFETSASDSTIIGGRIGIDQLATTVTGITGTDAVLGYHPAMPVEYDLSQAARQGIRQEAAYLHVACKTAGAVAKGSWLFARDSTSP